MRRKSEGQRNLLGWRNHGYNEWTSHTTHIIHQRQATKRLTPFSPPLHRCWHQRHESPPWNDHTPHPCTKKNTPLFSSIWTRKHIVSEIPKLNNGTTYPTDGNSSACSIWRPRKKTSGHPGHIWLIFIQSLSPPHPKTSPRKWMP